MSRLPSTSTPAGLIHDHGQSLMSAPQAMVKGALESEIEITLIVGSAKAIAPMRLDALRRDALNDDALRQHNLRLVAVPHASRGLTLAAHAARAGKGAVALVLNEELDAVVNEISQLAAEPLVRGSICLLLEDAPHIATASCPRRAVQRLNLPCIEVCQIEHVRDAMEHAHRLSRAGKCLSSIIVHESIMRSVDTLENRPNRVGSMGVIALKRRRSRGLRGVESSAPLRVARRLELNRFRAVPSPGERVAVGFITVGPADAAMLHITNALGLHGRVPVLQLGLIHPVDESAVGRLLTRCQKVIVLEPRPGAVETAVLAVAEFMRHKGDQPAEVWGRWIPPTPEGMAQTMTSDADLHPSVLVRKIAHLLHAIRPTVQVASQLVAEPPPVPAVPPREWAVGSAAALTIVRRIVTDVDQWLRDSAPLEDRGLPPTAMVIEGAPAAGPASRMVNIEIWDHVRFQHTGIPALVQASREDRPWILLVCEVMSQDIRDLERLARGAVPAERADRVRLETANLADRIALRDLIREASLSDLLTIIIVRDGPPARYDVAAIEQSLAEIDRLGFEPRQRLIRPAEEVCLIRPGTEDAPQEHEWTDDPHALEPEFTMEQLSSGADAAIRMNVRPLLEEIQVLRTKPPVRRWRGAQAQRLPVPQPLHGRQGHWRAHLAGFRSEPPGLAARVLCEAGRNMGYHVRCVHDPTPIATGRRAWAQVLFTHPRTGEAPSPLSTAIPYGEADLLLGLDGEESLRAVGPDNTLRIASVDRTHAIINLGDFTEEAPEKSSEDEMAEPRLDDAETDERVSTDNLSSRHAAKAIAAFTGVTRADGRMLADFSAACRTWFHTDRVADMALLGAAFQLGLVPVSLEAIEGAVDLMEARGYGRSRETFEFGRRLAVDSKLFTRPKDDREENVNRLARRMVLTLSRGEWGGGSRARNFSHLLHQSLHAMPGLAETDAGRVARRDFVVACHRCRIWGGFEYARQYAELITSLYRVDRGDTGRALTRLAVLPLAESMLIRDPLHVASMASSSEQRRRMRIRMNVKLARGDRIERRYLTRLELVAFNRRFRADVRTSDWPARVVAMMRRIVPHRLRGSRRERELREFIVDFVKQAVAEAPRDHDRWQEFMLRLHNQAAEGRLRGMAIAELKMLVAGSMPAASAPAPQALAAADL